MKSQSLNILCQFIIRKILIKTWKKRAIGLSNKYEIIEHKEMQIFVIWIDLFFTTDIDWHVSPSDRKE